MRSCRLAALVLLAACSTAWAAEPPELARARMLYNAGSYEEAIAAAAAVRGAPDFADEAALVIARSYLERHRQTANATDLTAARDALAVVRPEALSPRDRVDLVIGLGQTLYADAAYGAAAQLFDTALGQRSLLDAADRALLLDWWASALEREAQTRPPDGRTPLFAQIAVRMDEELAREPGSAVANYWVVAAARGEGDLERAWDAALAAWVRSRLAPDAASTAKLRADIDRLVTEALIPERARRRPQGEQQQFAESLGEEWQEVKENWK